MTGQAFQPVNDDHAIDRVEFALTFAHPFEAADLNLVRGHHDRWRPDLPRNSEPTAFTFNFEAPNKLARPEPLAGVEFSFVRPDGSSVWALRVIGNQATVECTRYSRWAKVWGTARRHLDHLLEALSYQENPNPIASVSLAVVDIFTADPAAYDLADLIQEGPLIPSASFGRGPNWHSHTGWFESAPDGRVLHNLNIESVERPPGPSGALAAVSILHSMALGRSASAEGIDREADKAWLAPAMEHLHMANKTVMSSLIAPALLQRFGLRTSS